MSSDNPLNLDAWGLPTMAGDGGDSAHNYYTIAYCCHHTNQPMPTLLLRPKQLLFSASGWPRRHPDITKWYSREGRCSRDLLTPVLCFYALPGNKGFWSLVRVLATHLFMLANNYRHNHVYEDEQEHAQKATPDVKWRPGLKLPDILFADVWAVLIRGITMRLPFSGLFLPIIWPMLCILDLQGLLNALITRYGAYKHDQRNQAIKSHFCCGYIPTITSILAHQIYLRAEPNRAFNDHWQRPGQPRVDVYMNALYSQE